MDARIVEFAEVLRQNGLRVGTSEVADAARAALEVGLEDRERFRSALQATLVKRSEELETFRRAFEFYFSGTAKTFEGIDRSIAQEIKDRGLLEGDELTMVLWQMGQLAGGMSPLAQATFEGDRAKLAQIFRGAALQLDLSQMQTSFQSGFYSRRLMASAGAEKMRQDLIALQGELKARGLSAEGLEIVSRELNAALRRVEDAARREVERQAKARLKKAQSTLADRNLHTLSRAETERMQAAVRTLAEKLKSRLMRKQKAWRRGSLNVRKTLRKNLPWGGIPMVPQFKNRRPERPEVVVLCDVSDSVRNHSRMMLLFMHTLQSLFVRVRSFVFVSDVGEVTDIFKTHSVEEAIDLAVAGQNISLSANSNYGNALASFSRDHLASITRRTTVLVIGDGRNNYNAANAWVLDDLKRKAKRLVWICSEDRPNWGFGDSEMTTYSKHCHQTVVVQSLNDLARLADQIVPV